MLFESARADHVRERTRLAKAIHDELGQALTAAGLELELLKLDHPEVSDAVSEAQRKLETAFDHARKLNDEVQPDPASKFGLRGALERLATRFRARYEGQFNLDLTGDDYPEGPMASAVYEIVVCALDNVLQHSYSRTVTLSTMTRPRGFAVLVQDDGVGFKTEATPKGYGLTLMKFMSEVHRLRLTVRGSVRRGTMVRLDGERELQNKKIKKIEGNATQHADRRVAGR